MKRSIIIIFTLILAMAFSYNASAKSSNSPVGTLNAAAEAQRNQSIQSRIMDAFMSAYLDKNYSEIESIIDELSDSYKNSGKKIFLYWKGYALYYNSVAYLQNREAKKSNKNITEGLELMESIKNKNSEDYALLSLMHSFYRLFAGFAILETTQKCNDCAEKAFELDNNNVRAYYVLANNDLYTGGKNIEKYILKALAIKQAKSNDPYLPTWGREESYGLLTSYYIKKKQFDKARKYLDLGLKEFPNSYTLKENQSKLK